MAKQRGDTWVSPICWDAESAAKVLRDCMDELGYKFKRDKDSKHYTKIMLLLPIPKFAYVWRYEVSAPSKFVINTYDTYPTHSSVMPYMEIDDISGRNIQDIKKLLRLFVQKLPRAPWQFTLRQRFMHGFAMPEFGRAKRAWRNMGFKV